MWEMGFVGFEMPKIQQAIQCFSAAKFSIFFVLKILRFSFKISRLLKCSANEHRNSSDFFYY